MRVIPTVIPTFEALKLPAELDEIVDLRNGIALVTGPTGSGKSSTLAAIRGSHECGARHPYPDHRRSHRVLCTITKKPRSTSASCTPTRRPSLLALRAALRQAPKVILVGEMRDRETIEIALEAAETGHLVLSTLHTIDASKTIERIVGAFPLSDQQIVRTRFAKAFRFIISQRLLPRSDGKGRVAVLEILKSTMRTREYVEKGENEGKTLLDAMRDGSNDGMQYFDGEIEKLIRAGTVDVETGLSYRDESRKSAPGAGGLS